MWRFYGCVFCLCAFLIDGCVPTKQQKNGNLGDIEEKSNLIKLKVCDKDFRQQIWFPPRVPILSLVLFLKSSAISFGCKMHPIHGSRYVTVISLGTALRSGVWEYSFFLKSDSGYPSWCQQKQTKEVESRSPSSERTNQHLVKEMNQTQEQSILTNQWGNQKRLKHVTKVVCSEEDVSNGDLVCNHSHPVSNNNYWNPQSRIITTEIPGNFMTNSGSHSHIHLDYQYTMDETTRSWNDRERKRETQRTANLTLASNNNE